MVELGAARVGDLRPLSERWSLIRRPALNKATFRYLLDFLFCRQFPLSIFSRSFAVLRPPAVDRRTRFEEAQRARAFDSRGIKIDDCFHILFFASSAALQQPAAGLCVTVTTVLILPPPSAIALAGTGEEESF